MIYRPLRPNTTKRKCQLSSPIDPRYLVDLFRSKEESGGPESESDASQRENWEIE